MTHPLDRPAVWVTHPDRPGQLPAREHARRDGRVLVETWDERTGLQGYLWVDEDRVSERDDSE